MNVVLIIPTGIGCEIGGHAGDANPVAKLIAQCCDKLITHPNVVNASDINEMPDNTLYVEGSILDRFLQGQLLLKEVLYNKILLAVNAPVTADTINAVNAARTTIGADIEIMPLNTPLEMTGFYDKKGKATGRVKGVEHLCTQSMSYDFDAMAIQTDITIKKELKMNYLTGTGGVNCWGGIEAITSKIIADTLDKPVAHAPFVDWPAKEDDMIDFNEVVDPRMSAEMVSISYLHSVLKGLHKAPRITYGQGLSVKSIDFLITPINCVGPPHKACMDQGIPIIAVKENKSVLNDTMPDSFIVVDNYMEAAGLLMSYKAGVHRDSVRRPIKKLKIPRNTIAN